MYRIFVAMPALPRLKAAPACQQQCQALSYRQRPHPPVEGGRPRSGDGTLLCAAQLPGARESVAANGLIEINSDVFPTCGSSTNAPIGC